MSKSKVQARRHCAYCLESLTLLKGGWDTCDQCDRRAYCNEECQALDWDGTFSGNIGPMPIRLEFMDGQFHFQWCGLGVLEEDVDWEVVKVEGKGLGVVAKTIIPPMRRIVVDGPTFKDSRRVQLFNHSCDANAAQLVEEDEDHEEGRWPGAFIVYSKREIQPGEEICVNYTKFNETPWGIEGSFCPKVPMELRVLDKAIKCRHILEMTFGVVCPAECFCRKKGFDKAVADWKEDLQYVHCPMCIEECLEARNKQGAVFELDCLMNRVVTGLQRNEELQGNQITRAILLQKGFEVAARSRLTLDKGVEYIKEAVEIRKSVGHPRSLKLEKAEAYLKDPSSYEEYLCLDKKWGELDRDTLCHKNLKKHLQMKNNRRGSRY